MKAVVFSVALSSLAVVNQAFVIPNAPVQQRAMTVGAGRNMEMMFGNFFPKKEASSSGPIAGSRPKAIATVSKSTKGKPVVVAGPRTQTKMAPAKPPSNRPVKTGVAEVPSGYFTESQMAAFRKARQEVPSSAPNYWEKIAARVPGQSAANCQQMAQKLAFDRAAGTKSNFFGGYIDVKEPEMVVDYSATPMNRFKEAFGFGKKD